MTRGLIFSLRDLPPGMREQAQRKLEEAGKVRTHRVRDEPDPERSRPRNPRSPVVAEKYVLRACLELLASHPRVALFWRQNTGMAMNPQGLAIRFSPKGTPDILGVLKGSGKFFCVECKATGKTASPEQRAYLDAVNRAGGLGVCVDDPKQLIEALRSQPGHPVAISEG